nr:glycerophosphodiester phosphodiesterase family protein [Pseudoalteromonas flavipulchra]
MASSVAAGANVIHLNVHRTRDDQLVVFHDWTLDCAT